MLYRLLQALWNRNTLKSNWNTLNWGLQGSPRIVLSLAGDLCCIIVSSPLSPLLSCQLSTVIKKKICLTKKRKKVIFSNVNASYPPLKLSGLVEVPIFAGQSDLMQLIAHLLSCVLTYLSRPYFNRASATINTRLVTLLSRQQVCQLRSSHTRHTQQTGPIAMHPLNPEPSRT